MNSRDKKQKEQSSGKYNLVYKPDENQTIFKKANSVGMTTEEYIKFISLHSVKDYSKIITDLKRQTDENKELKAKLSFFTDDLDGGLFLDIENETLLRIFQGMDDFGRHFDSVEEYIVYASLNLNQLIKGTINKTMEEFKRQWSAR
ncbi:MAG: hypothetical protein DRJ10_00945 [Bacteroidetes bacterium]|nr:MAG: hypothetical protein DRJ10_00945 [Bacteroidota bacterium]